MPFWQKSSHFGESSHLSLTKLRIRFVISLPKMAAMNNYLTGELNFPNDIANEIVNIHTYTTHDDFATATQDEIKTMVSTVRKTPNPAADAAADTKIVVGQQIALRFGFFTHYCKYIERVSRTHTVALGNIANITKIGRFYNSLVSLTIADLSNFPEKFDNKNSRIGIWIVAWIWMFSNDVNQ